KRFNGADQPVVGISWYAARAYCFWLSCLECVVNRQEALNIETLGGLFRLPNVKEWEWATSGRPGKSVRKYPWGDKKPTAELANYDKNVGTTTPVGRYMEGATPEGLMDMAGNVFEWMDNWCDGDKDSKTLRGGSWLTDASLLFCGARFSLNPVYGLINFGFRVVLPGQKVEQDFKDK
ncbi:MAG: formylglycine-generating enzyme family protein, partial [bacterium]|nr:formylglycine-generating enzyme family protein [bacterium]